VSLSDSTNRCKKNNRGWARPNTWDRAALER
jgi:hypothetical protein